jgi:hypothetical protein
MTGALLPSLFNIVVGLTIALFHRPIADFMLEKERLLVAIFHQRGLRLPPPPTPHTAYNIYFGLGIFVVLFEMAHLWLRLP